VLFRPDHKLPGMGRAGPHDRDLRVRQSQPEKDCLYGCGIVQVGGSGPRHQGQAANVDDQVALAHVSLPVS
jgi:hypothetical protein